jgi:chromosome partitioning protein
LTNLNEFVDDMKDVMSHVSTKLQRDLTLRERVSRRFSKKAVCKYLGVSYPYIQKKRRQEPLFPRGASNTKRMSYSPDDINLMRAFFGSQADSRMKHSFWRKKGDPIKIITVGSQKGGVGKSLISAQLAQYLSLAYGMRVGLIDSDPQSTLSLYFADNKLPLFHPETRTVADFMGVESPGAPCPTLHDPVELNEMWQQTPWSGIRLLPGGGNILNGDVSLFFMSQQSHTPVYRVLLDSINRWDSDFGVKTDIKDLRDKKGNFRLDRYNAAINETVDVIIIDQQPSISLMQINGVVCADTLVIPQTMRGFDLSTLTTYVNSLSEYFDFITKFDPNLKLGKSGHVVLPSIVNKQHDSDLLQIQELYQRAPDKILPCFYYRSDAISNASEQYKSIYEYTPPKSRTSSAAAFIDNSNSVNDALVSRIFPDFPLRGFKDDFIKEHWSHND